MRMTALACAVLFSFVCFAASPTLGEPFNTENTASDVHLENGAALHFSAHSTGTIFVDHAVIEQGAAHVSNFAGYKVQAGELQIETDKPTTQAAIRIGQNSIEIASLGGNLRVSAAGTLLTTVSSGSRLAFQNTGATPPAQTGAAPGKKARSELKTWTWIIIGISAAALAIGLTAVAQGKSPL